MIPPDISCTHFSFIFDDNHRSWLMGFGSGMESNWFMVIIKIFVVKGCLMCCNLFDTVCISTYRYVTMQFDMKYERYSMDQQQSYHTVLLLLVVRCFLWQIHQILISQKNIMYKVSSDIHTCNYRDRDNTLEWLTLHRYNNIFTCILHQWMFSYECAYV